MNKRERLSTLGWEALLVSIILYIIDIDSTIARAVNAVSIVFFIAGMFTSEDTK